MRRNRVGGKGIERQQVQAGGRFGRQAMVARRDADDGIGLATAQIAELPGVARDADDHRIDLVEAPALPRLGIAGERPRPQPTTPIRAAGPYSIGAAPHRSADDPE